MRYHDWPERLFTVVKKAKQSTFVWGENDCALFACDCVKAMTGIDHASKARGKYKTEKGAWRALAKIEGVKTLPELADKYLGSRIDLVNAKRGDVVSLIVDSAEALGIVVGSCAVFLTINGARTVPLHECILAWEVN